MCNNAVNFGQLALKSYLHDNAKSMTKYVKLVIIC